MPGLPDRDSVEWKQTLLAHDCRTYAVFDKIKATMTCEEVVEAHGAKFIASLFEAQLIERDGPSGHFRMTPAAESLLR